jgi:hypothetical protein
MSDTNNFIVLYHRLHVSTYIQVIFKTCFTGESINCYACWDPIMLTAINYLNTKNLCWSNKAETGNAIFITLRSVFIFLGGAILDVLIFYRICMPVLCPMFLLHVLLCCLLGLWYVCFIELEMSMVLCVLVRLQVGWACVPVPLCMLLRHFMWFVQYVLWSFVNLSYS